MANEKKALKLLQHLRDGGSLDRDTLAEILGMVPTSTAAMERYLVHISEQRPSEFPDGLAIDGINPLASEDDEDYDDEEDGSEEHDDSEDQDDDSDDDEEEDEDEEDDDYEDDDEDDEGPDLFYMDAQGISHPVYVFSQNDKRVVLKDKEIEDIVKIILKGEVVEVDLIPLRKKDQGAKSEYGISNAKLLQLALAAKP